MRKRNLPNLHLVRNTDIINFMDLPNNDVGAVLESWGEWMRNGNLSPRTISERVSVITRFLRWSQADPLNITAQDLLRFMDRPELSNASRATYHTTFRAYFLWLVRTKRATHNPMEETPTPKRHRNLPRPITAAQLQLVLDVANRRRTRMMVLLGAFQGLRVHEIAKIRGQDFDWDAGVLYITGKGGNTAMLPVHPLVVEAGKDFPAMSDWFPSWEYPGQPISGSAVSKSIRSTFDRAEVVATPHQLRHFYGTSLARNGVSLRVVQELMRHASLATTQIYTQVDAEQMRAGLVTLQLPGPLLPLAA